MINYFIFFLENSQSAVGAAGGSGTARQTRSGAKSTIPQAKQRKVPQAKKKNAPKEVPSQPIPESPSPERPLVESRKVVRKRKPLDQIENKHGINN